MYCESMIAAEIAGNQSNNLHSSIIEVGETVTCLQGFTATSLFVSRVKYIRLVFPSFTVILLGLGPHAFRHLEWRRRKREIECVAGKEVIVNLITYNAVIHYLG